MAEVVWVSPLPPVRSGVSDYTAEMVPELARHVRLRLLTPPEWQPSGWTPPAGTRVAGPDYVPSPEDTVVVHLGNNPHHAWTLRFLRGPGTVVVVLHDLVLHHLLVETTLAQGDFAAYRRLLEQAHGRQGAVLAGARRFGFTGRRDPFLFPARGPFLDGVRVAVTHSRWGAARVARDRPDLAVRRVPMGVADPGDPDRDALRRELGVGAGELILMHLGFLTPAKGLRAVLVAVAAARRRGIPVRLVLVGEEGGTGYEVQALARELGITRFLSLTGWVEGHVMRQLPAAADLGVVIRTPSAGETSAAALRFLACGTPVAVSGLHQMLELPEAVAPRLTPSCEAPDLVRLLGELVRDPRKARVRRSEARRFFAAGHRIGHAVEGWCRLLDEFGGSRAG